jgi:hypothetical protein
MIDLDVGSLGNLAMVSEPSLQPPIFSGICHPLHSALYNQEHVTATSK